MSTEVENVSPEGSESPVEAAGVPSGGTDSGEQNNSREKRYRLERNEARQERDALVQKVESLLTREAERIASRALAEPADLFSLTGKTVKDFVGEDGELDEELILDTANDLLGFRPGLAKNAPAVDVTQGHGFQGGKPKIGWGILLKD